MSDNAHGNGHVQPQPTMTMRQEAALAQSQAPLPTWRATPALMRLLLGVALEGGDEFITRLRAWEAADHSSTSAPTVGETRGDFWRYALLGMMIETPVRLRNALSPIWDIADELACEVLADAESALEHWPFKLLKWPVEQLAFDWTVAVVRWSATGHREAQQGRQLARQAAASLLDEFLNDMASNPEVRKLLEQQTASVAGSAVDTLRERSVSADTSIERLVHSLLRRPGNARSAEVTTDPSTTRPPEQSG